MSEITTSSTSRFLFLPIAGKLGLRSYLNMSRMLWIRDVIRNAAGKRFRRYSIALHTIKKVPRQILCSHRLIHYHHSGTGVYQARLVVHHTDYLRKITLSANELFLSFTALY